MPSRRTGASVGDLAWERPALDVECVRASWEELYAHLLARTVPSAENSEFSMKRRGL